MPVLRVLVAAALALLLPGAATAQSPAPQQTQIQLQYHEMVPGGDSTPVFLKIFEKIHKDCGLVGKAFGQKCVINQINIYTNMNYSGEMAGT